MIFLSTLYILMVVSARCTTDDVMTREAKQTILDLTNDLELRDIKSSPVPLHRLDGDGVAYYLVEADHDFLITRADKTRGKRDLIMQGHLPSPITTLENEARAKRSACARFYILSPEGELLCKNAEGSIMATTIPEEHIKRSLNEGNYDSVDHWVEAKRDILAKQWDEHTNAKRDLPSAEEFLHTSDQLDDSPLDLSPALGKQKRGLAESLTSFELKPIKVGETVKVVIGDVTSTKEIRIKYLSLGGQSDEDASAGQAALCHAIDNCEMKDSVGTIPTNLIVKSTISYIPITLMDNATEILGRNQTAFDVEEVHQNDTASGNVYEVIYPAKRVKRRKETKSWSGFYYRSIGKYGTMPDYNQFQYGGCSVGCGPVAWAQIFGYFDRRSHYYGYSWGSKYLYRNGADGTTGSYSQIAPYTLSGTRIRKYIQVLNHELRTFCLFSGGATFMSRMDDIEPFFQYHQKTGNPQVYYKKTLLSVAGIYQNAIESYARAKIRDGWAVIIAKWHGLAWHYPVMIRYRYRKRQYRICFVFICGSWKWEYDYDWYLKYGWGGSANGWYNMKAFYAVYARY